MASSRSAEDIWSGLWVDPGQITWVTPLPQNLRPFRLQPQGNHEMTGVTIQSVKRPSASDESVTFIIIIGSLSYKFQKVWRKRVMRVENLPPRPAPL